MELTHLDEQGRARMVDVGGKPDTERVAVARGEVTMRPETLRLIAAGGAPKGDVLAVAQVAGIMAAKRVPDLIPLCHPLLITKADVEFEIDESASRIIITATARCRGQTGVEMEALTAVSVAALEPPIPLYSCPQRDTLALAADFHGAELFSRAPLAGQKRLLGYHVPVAYITSRSKEGNIA